MKLFEDIFLNIMCMIILILADTLHQLAYVLELSVSLINSYINYNMSLSSTENLNDNASNIKNERKSTIKSKKLIN